MINNVLLYNNHMLPEEELRLPLSNRAFQYNDGFFETIIVRQGSLSFWDAHLERMQEAAEALRLQLPIHFSSGSFPDKLLDLVTQQQALTYGRLKLKVWRSGAGLYTPETNEVEWLATAQPVAPAATAPLQVGVCQHIRTLYSPLSHFKGPNAPLYVQAGLEKKATTYDDMLLLDRHGAVAELTAANIFWLRHGILYTPPLETGCINGVLRRNILRCCREQQINVIEASIDISILKQAGLAFAANVTGIRIIGHIEEAALPATHPLLKQLQKALFG